jgi:hypothetical protein
VPSASDVEDGPAADRSSILRTQEVS